MGYGAVVRWRAAGLVEQVTRELKAREVRCFYDTDEEIELWRVPRPVARKCGAG